VTAERYVSSRSYLFIFKFTVMRCFSYLNWHAVCYNCHTVPDFCLFLYFYKLFCVGSLLFSEFVLMYFVVALLCRDERLDIFTELPTDFVLVFLALGLLILCVMKLLITYCH
jgi:hypothetical protein